HIETPSRLEHASDVAEPSVEQQVKGLVGNEVIRQRTILGPHLLMRSLGLLGVAFQVELLVVLIGCREAAVSGGDSVVGARFDANVVRRICIAQMDLRTGEQPVQIFGTAAVAAEQTMIAQYPKIARL